MKQCKSIMVQEKLGRDCCIPTISLQSLLGIEVGVKHSNVIPQISKHKRKY